MNIAELNPKEVFTIFDQSTKIPRPSKKEELIRNYLKEFAKIHSLNCKEDAKGNIVISKPASKGYENKSGVVLQSHVDMVCEKEPTSTHNFDTDPIETYVEDGWIKAQGTTLGADCGIGMALQLAALTADIEHPAIEALFTVDEEQGLSGAFELGENMLTHSLMINLDSEDEGEIFIGCAGGIDTIARYQLQTEIIESQNYKIYQLNVSSLKGGHSGDDIEKGRASANKLMARLLWELTSKFGAKIASIDGGNLRNAIAREAVAVVAIEKSRVESALDAYAALGEQLKAEYSVTEPTMAILAAELDKDVEVVLENELQTRLLRALLGVDNGIIEMSASMHGMVETSTNLASVKFESDTIVVTTSQRSSVESAKYSAALTVESVFALSGAVVEHSDGYPGWKPNPSSELVRKSAELYEKLFGVKPKVKAIHAGLECGLLLDKYPKLDIISIGPTIRDAHSPSERLNIESVANYWLYLCELLKK